MPRLAGMKLEQVKAALQSLKGDGAWRSIAVRSEIHYDTVARIARGAIKNPSAQTVEKLGEAIAHLRRSVRKPEPAEASNG